MRQITLFLAIIFSSAVNYAQIVSNNKVNTKTRPANAERTDSTWNTVGQTWFFLGAGYQIPKSVVKSNTNAFGKPLGMRAEEKMENRFTYQLGIRSHVHRFVTVEAGFMIDRYGQSYSYKSSTTDSTYSYTRDYTFISLPIQAYFTYGKRFKLYLGAGIQPMITMKNHLETTYADSLGNDTETTVNKKETMNFLNFTFLASAGISFQATPNIGFYFIPSYAYGLTNIYNKQAPYREWLSGMNFKFGLSINTQNWNFQRKKKKKAE